MFINSKTGQRKPELPVNQNVQTPEAAKLQWEAEGWIFPPGAAFDEGAKAWTVRAVKEDDAAGQGE